MTNPIYEELKTLSLPHIQAYHDDLLVHDKKSINSNRPFIHYTREMGTHIYFLHDMEDLPAPGERIPYLFGTADYKKILNDFIEMTIWHSKPQNTTSKLIVYFDGTKFTEINADKAIEIAREHVDKVLTGVQQDMLDKVKIKCAETT